METKKCSRCNIEKLDSLDFFRFRADTKKLMGVCRECERKRSKEKSHSSEKFIENQRKKIEQKLLLSQGFKICNTCNNELPIDRFSRAIGNKSHGLAGSCRVCTEKNRDRFSSRLAERCKQYGITKEEFNNMKIAQNNKCAICGIDEGLFSESVLHIDHCHKTHKVRGLLCRKCNTALGNFKDNVSILQKAIEYLG